MEAGDALASAAAASKHVAGARGLIPDGNRESFPSAWIVFTPFPSEKGSFAVRDQDSVFEMNPFTHKNL